METNHEHTTVHTTCGWCGGSGHTAARCPQPRQRRHESPDVGDAIVRMLRGLVTRASEGDTEAVEQLARIEYLSGVAVALGGRLAHDLAGYSYTELACVLDVTRQAARQRAMGAYVVSNWPVEGLPEAHQLLPGHTRRGCDVCASLAQTDAVMTTGR